MCDKSMNTNVAVDDRPVQASKFMLGNSDKTSLFRQRSECLILTALLPSPSGAQRILQSSLRTIRVGGTTDATR